ncbi:MAG: hypothetical protein LBJ00_15290 [Planctomycetaceae bacterium]|jgi:hypothetical protein|nr:hypothetical protein [Planctomycetaceae bacterium]
MNTKFKKLTEQIRKIAKAKRNVDCAMTEMEKELAAALKEIETETDISPSIKELLVHELVAYGYFKKPNTPHSRSLRKQSREKEPDLFKPDLRTLYQKLGDMVVIHIDVRENEKNVNYPTLIHITAQSQTPEKSRYTSTFFPLKQVLVQIDDSVHSTGVKL